MATIKTAIQLYNGVSGPMSVAIGSINNAVASFEVLQKVSSNAIDTRTIEAARADLIKTQSAVNQIEQEMRNADQAQQQLNNSMFNGQGAAGGLLGKLKGLALSIGAAFGAKEIIELSDTVTSTKARLDLMNDGLQTTVQLQNMIFASAQRSRSSYLDTAAAVGKLGILAKSAFSNNKEMVFFAEQMNKQFKIGGASLMEQTSAMYQLTQAMAAGKLQGDEFRSIMENAPMLAQAIAQYTGKSMGQLKQMSAEGTITADIIKNAMFASADATNKKFATLPMTFGQVTTVIGNMMLQTFQPVLQVIGQGAQFIYDNWSTIEPIFWGLTTAIGAFAAMWGVQTAATWLATAAAKDFFMTLLTNPLMWIAMIIGIVVSMVYKWVQSVGGIKVAWAIVTNFLLSSWDMIKIGFMTGCDAVQTFMGNMKVKVLTILQSMVNTAIDIINAYIKNVNMIPGVNIGLIDHVTFATEAAIDNQAAQAARDANLEQMKADAAQAREAREANLNQMKADAAKANQDSQLDNIAASSGATAGNTGKMADSMEASAEELRYLRDLAEMEVINRFTTAEIKIDQNNTFGDVRETADIDGIVSYLNEALEESINSIAEGV